MREEAVSINEGRKRRKYRIGKGAGIAITY
jgi:hypothetical protein